MSLETPWKLWLVPRAPFGGARPPRDETLVSLLGFPLDETGSFLPGTRMAPDAVRRVSESLEWFSYYLDKPLPESLVYDEGDIAIVPGDLEESLRRLSLALEALSRGEKRVPIVLGGEHTLTHAALGLLRKTGAALVVFDAHGDLRDEYLGSRLNHATVMRRLLDHLEPERLVLVGTRALSEEEERLARDQGLRIVSARHVWQFGLRETTHRLLGFLRDHEAVYISIDVDVLDPAYAPGVGTPEPLGLSPQELVLLLGRLVSEKSLVAMDIVEHNPLAEGGYATSALVAKLVIEAAGVLWEKSRD